MEQDTMSTTLPSAFSKALSQNIDALQRFADLPYEDRQKLLRACSPSERKAVQDSMKILNR